MRTRHGRSTEIEKRKEAEKGAETPKTIERLLALSDWDQTFSYCLLETPIPLFNYVAHVTLKPVTDGDATLWRWCSQFTTPEGKERELSRIVGEDIYVQGFTAIKRMLERN